MTRTLLNLLPSSTVARLLAGVGLVVAALIVCLHFFEGPEGRADSPLADLWYVPVLALAAAVVVEVVSRRRKRP